MKLQENIRSILREEKDQTKLIKGIIDSSDIFNYKYFCGFDIIRPEEKTDQFLIKVYFVGGPNSKVWPRTQAVRNKEYNLIEELYEYIKSFVPFNIEMMASHVNSCDGYNKLMKRKYSTNDLQENIRRILKEETKPGKYISALKDLTEDFKNEDCVCDIKIEYKPEEEIYLINVILGNLDIDDKFNGVNWRERDYRGKLKTKIRKEVFDYLPIPFFVEFKQTPKCKDYKNLKESEDKKSRLLSTIEQDGLYQVMQDTGLSLKQIKSKIGELPREVFERYVKDFLEKDEIGWDLSIQISPNKIVDSFYLSDDVVTIELNEVDSRGRVVAGSFDRLSVLSDEEIFSLVNEMSQINFDNHFDLW
jgi:hypothetical protein